MPTLSMLHAAAPCLLFLHCLAMSTFSTLLGHVNFFTLLHHVCFIHAAAPCVLFPLCCTMSSLSTLMCHVNFYHAAVPCLLFHTTAPCLLFPCCCDMSALSKLLRHVYFSTLLCYVYFSMLLRFVYCDMSTVSTMACLLWHSSVEKVDIVEQHVYVFHAATLCLLFPNCCAMSTFSTLLGYVDFFSLFCCAMYNFSTCCVMSTFTKLLHYVYFSMLLRYGFFFHTP